ncbi:MAG: ABC transporter ATP-binding protein [Gammaproteobacteria bacterium]|nr:ABC transporter ATP-binding protein [Gammaproteobacteria bacterium]
MSHVVAEHISVEFPIYGPQSRSLKNTVIRAASGGTLARDAGQRVVVRALNNVNFSFKEGDRVGIFGHNGSGKSTLLRVITGTYEPSSGAISVSGKIASMLSISVGMEAEATGLENIYLRGTLMGLKPKEISTLTDGIADFTDLGYYLEMPLRTYSSGMYMRLAFAISTSVPADILVMDEWLSVGDASFYEKAQLRLKKMLDQSKMMFLASHDEDLIRKNCNVLIRLNHGEITELDYLS